MVGFPGGIDERQTRRARGASRIVPVRLRNDSRTLGCAIGTVLLPTKLTPIARTGAVVIRSGAERTMPPLVPATVMAYVPSATSGGTNHHR